MTTYWLDCDPGFDDWLAWMLIEQAAAELPSVVLSGVSLVHGNARLEQIQSNAQAIKQLMHLSAGLSVGEAAALAGPGETAERVLGTAGMRSAGLRLPSVIAADLPLLHAQISGLPVPDIVLATGPLTNIAKTLSPWWRAKDGQPAQSMPELIWMGGSSDRGNHTAAAEFNALADPQAAALAFAGIRVRMVGLNVCRQVLLHQADLLRFRALASLPARVFTDHLDGYQRIRSKDGSEPMPLYDPVAVAAALHPEWFEFTPARVDVECSGDFTRGMTVCEFRLNEKRQANALVATAVQGELIAQWVLDSAYQYLLRFE